MMGGVQEGLKGQNAMPFLEKALEADRSCAAIYEEIAYFSSPYSRKAKEAVKAANALKRKISLEELEEIPLEERTRFSFFLEMEIKKNIKRPRGFVEEWK